MNPTQPTKLVWLIGLALFWALHGLTGRDAWRPEEALALGAVLDWLDGSRPLWGSPAPIYTLVAGWLAHWSPAGLDAQNAARLASAGFTLLALLCTGLTAHILYGRGFGAAAVLGLLGALGLMLRAHALTPEIALLAVWSLLFLGAMRATQQQWSAAWIIGLALALLTLGLRGLPDLAAALAVLLLPILHPTWRTPTYRRAVYTGLALGLILILLGIAWLDFADQLAAWLQAQKMRLDLPLRPVGKVFADLAWFAWPLWPLALAAVWHRHRNLGRSPEVLIPLVQTLVIILLSIVPAWSREGGLLPVLIPLALLTAYSLEHLRRGAANAFYWFGVLCFVFFSIIFWVYFSALEWNIPARLGAHLDRLSPAYTGGAPVLRDMLLAAAATLVWFIAIPLFPRARSRPILVWATGMVLTWVGIASLFKPWIEANYAYRPLVLEMRRHLPADACLSVREDAALAVMTRYHAKVKVRPGCRWTLTRLDAGRPASPDTVWEGRMPRQKKVIYRLERHGLE